MRSAAELVRRTLPRDVQDIDIEKASLADVVKFVERRSVAATDDPSLRNVTAPWITMRTLSTAWVGPVPDAPSDKTIVRFVVVSGEDARDDKDLHVEGIDFSGYDANPVWLYSHQWEMPPIGRCIKRQVFKRGNVYELWKDVEFTPADLYPFGHQIGQMHSRGWMRACSGGWLGTKIRVQRARDGSPERIVYVGSDWMETSSCSVGIDKFALQEAVERGFVDSRGAEVIARYAKPLSDARTYDVRERAARAFKPEAGRVLIEERNLDNPYEEEWQRAMKARPSIGALESRAAGGRMDKVECRNCAYMNDASARMCGKCKHEMRAAGKDVCPECGSDVSGVTDGKCPECGADLSMSEKPESDAPKEETRAVEDGKCEECGADLGDATAECPECGAPIPTDEEKAKKEEASKVVAERQDKAVAANDAEVEDEERDEEDAGDGEMEEDEEESVVMRKTKRAIDWAAMRGPVAQAMDTAYDQLFANTVTLAQICDELRSLSAGAFYENRSVSRGSGNINRKDIEKQFRAAFERQLPTLVMRAMEIMAANAQAPGFETMVSRQVDRGDACVTRIGNALNDIRDAVGLYVEEPTSEMDIAERAGRKIASYRRMKINSACTSVRAALRTLEEVLAEEDPIGDEDEKENSVEEVVEEVVDEAGDAMKMAQDEMRSITSAMRARIDSIIANRDVPSDDIAARAARLRSRFEKIITKSGEDDALRAKRSRSNIKGVRLP